MEGEAMLGAIELFVALWRRRNANPTEY